MRNTVPPNMQQQALRQMQQTSMSMRNPQNINRQQNPSMMNPNMRPNNMNPMNNGNNIHRNPNLQQQPGLQQPGGAKHRKDKTKIFGHDPSVPAPPGSSGAPQMNRTNSNGPPGQPQMGNTNSSPKIQVNAPKNGRNHADSVDSMTNTADDDIYGNYSQRGKSGPQQLIKSQSFQPGMNQPGMARPGMG